MTTQEQITVLTLQTQMLRMHVKMLRGIVAPMMMALPADASEAKKNLSDILAEVDAPLPTTNAEIFALYREESQKHYDRELRSLIDERLKGGGL